MPDVIVLGAGGHGQVTAEALLRAADVGADYTPVGFLDDDPRHLGATFLGLDVRGPLSAVDEMRDAALIVGIGDNAARSALCRGLLAAGRELVNAIHPAATIAPDVRLGCGVVVAAGVVVNTGAVIGDGVILNTSCSVDHHGQIGDWAHIAPGANLGGAVTVGEGALLGVGVAVVPGRRVGEWAVVGAGSTVTEDVRGRTTVVGRPARPIERHAAERHP